MTLKYVKIYNADLDQESEVKPESVHVWEDRGWVVRDENVETPNVEEPTAKIQQLDPVAQVSPDGDALTTDETP